jgi:hypothetical protein
MCFPVFPAKTYNGDRMEDGWHKGSRFEGDQTIDGHIKAFSKL